ncbi:WD repeat and FYVE domain-containing 3 [Brachionus plicatilis]|uniref:WD repeat and FYVE domain-containing 3 n=1 Tax=Brachionus plicatilis TaxID=10195 RepID=A0A3M7PXU1_BRAPC|nr:WD repeat and FYVE domain-containing 3 [Brachionus plicatilis]
MAGCECKAVAFGIYKIKLMKDKSIQHIFVVERRSGQRRARLPSQIRPNLLHLALHRQVRLRPIRLLTLIKHSKLKDTLSSCLCVYLSAKNHSLFVNTDECLLNQLKHVEKLSNSSVNFNCSELFQEGQWLHLAIVLSRAILKTSTCGERAAVHAVIGTLPMFRCQSAVVPTRRNVRNDKFSPRLQQKRQQGH